MTRLFLSMLATSLLGCAVLAPPAHAQDQAAAKVSVIPQTPEWQKLKTLVGEWDGLAEAGGKSVPATLEVRMTGDGSAIMHVMGKNTPYEMMTVFHPDGKRLLATHYCAAHNQPRLALVPSKAADQIAFEFVDGTNIGPGEEHINGVVFTFVDADHHEAAWTNSTSSDRAVFKYTRKKK